jgi:HD-GYP domain-containing protein (c-di-GMP phosphodiesterase class II)
LCFPQRQIKKEVEMLSEKEKLDALAHLGVDLNLIQDLDILMERILTDARRFVNADAGSIYIRDKSRLLFTYTQNDTLQSRLDADEKLIYSNFTVPINDNSIAGYVAKFGQPLNLPDVYQLDETCPYQFDKEFDHKTQYSTRSVLTIPLVSSTGDLLGILQIINAQNGNHQVVPFTVSDEKIMTHFASVAAIALARAQMTRAILLRMMKMAEMRDPKETGAHVNRVGGYAVEIYENWARRHRVSSIEIDKNRDVLRMAAMLHDVGKVAISDLILKKPGKLDEEEFDIMKQHTIFGAQLFMGPQSDFDDAAAQVALNHHERWDGHGYPGHVDLTTGEPLQGFSRSHGSARGKKGEEIPLFGRIVAIADVYDALASQRVYKEAWDEPEVLANIKAGGGHHFDPELVDVFFSCLNVLRSIKKRYQDIV